MDRLKAKSKVLKDLGAYLSGREAEDLKTKYAPKLSPEAVDPAEAMECAPGEAPPEPTPEELEMVLRSLEK